MNMFKELEGNLVAAIGKLLFSFLTRRQRAGSTRLPPPDCLLHRCPPS